MNTLVKVRMPYDRVYTPEQQEFIRQNSFEGMKVTFTDEGKLVYRYSSLIMFYSDYEILMSGVDEDPWTKGAIEAIVENSVTRRIAEFSQKTTTVVNEKCTVVVPGNALLNIDEVRAEENLCTEKLQAWINDGWRILAICVQPDQRRPDYILGKIKTAL